MSLGVFCWQFQLDWIIIIQDWIEYFGNLGLTMSSRTKPKTLLLIPVLWFQRVLRDDSEQTEPDGRPLSPAGWVKTDLAESAGGVAEHVAASGGDQRAASTASDRHPLTEEAGGDGRQAGSHRALTPPRPTVRPIPALLWWTVTKMIHTYVHIRYENWLTYSMPQRCESEIFKVNIL